MVFVVEKCIIQTDKNTKNLVLRYFFRNFPKFMTDIRYFWDDFWVLRCFEGCFMTDIRYFWDDFWVLRCFEGCFMTDIRYFWDDFWVLRCFEGCFMTDVRYFWMDFWVLRCFEGCFMTDVRYFWFSVFSVGYYKWLSAIRWNKGFIVYTLWITQTK